jgi:RNA polymerase sigma factor (sigma-70 family)
MGFPDTRHTLIQRIVAASDETDWRQFLDDYWGPVCRFAARYGSLSADDAEDVASQTFEALLTNQLLSRWMVNRSAKLRTLLCTVSRNVMSNRARVEQGRARLIREHLEQGGELGGVEAPAEQVDLFYAAWVEDLLEQAVELLLGEYLQSGKNDYFRVLHGRICEELSMNEIAECLGLKVTTAENFYKSARKRLASIFEDLMREHVGRYAAEDSAGEEFTAEWARLGNHLQEHGGLEQTIRRAYADRDHTTHNRKTEQINQTISRILPQQVPDGP